MLLTWPVHVSSTTGRVLLDAPCTGLGALRRRPESRWRRHPDDLDRLVPLQKALLDASLDAETIGDHDLMAEIIPGFGNDPGQGS